MLVLVDYQTTFVNLSETQAWRPEMTEMVRQEIEAAKQQRLPIAVVLYEGSGPLIPEIEEMIGKYRRTRKVLKRYNDGSDRLRKKLKVGERSLPFRFIGGNIAACLGETAIGFAKCGRDEGNPFDITINLSASYDGWNLGKEDPWVRSKFQQFLLHDIKVSDPLDLWGFQGWFKQFRDGSLP